MTDLDLIDRKIVAELMRDATLPIAQIAEKAGLSQTPCCKRIQKQEAAGVLTGRVALADPFKPGFGLTVFMGSRHLTTRPTGARRSGKSSLQCRRSWRCTGWPESWTSCCASPCRTWRRSIRFTNA